MEIGAYTDRLVDVLRGTLGDRLIAVYLHGSIALGGFRPDRSDVDVLAVVADGTPRERLLEVAEAVSQHRLPAPGQGLELDVLEESAVRRPQNPSPFALNVGSDSDGERVTLGADHGPHGDPILHMAAAAAAGITLYGPPPQRLIGTLPREWLLDGFDEELDWGLEHGSAAYAALNAARSWRYAETGAIGSKLDGGEWALGRGFDAILLHALAFQRGETAEPPDRDAAAQLVARAQGELHAARG